MIVQAGPDRASNKPKIDEMPKNPSQTEGREGVDNINKVPKTSSLTGKRGAFRSSMSTPSIAKDRAPAFSAVDLRDKSPEVRAACIAELREALNKIGDNPSGRAEAKRVTLLKILCK